MIIFDTIIIGGGPAGLFAARSLPKGTSISVLEKNRSLCRKLLISGSGRCNFTNALPINDFPKHYGNASRWIARALNSFTNDDLRRVLAESGIHSYTDENGKVFPRSENAEDIKSFLVDGCHRNSVQIITDCAVESITVGDGPIFHIVGSGIEFSAKTVLIASGGRSYPTTGSTGDGYALAKAMGHSLILPHVALTPVYLSPNPFTEISGVSLCNVGISIRRSGKIVHKHTGDIGFTHRGISGPGILDPSRYMEADDELLLSFSMQSEEAFSAEFVRATTELGSATVKSYLRRIELPESLLRIILSQAGMSGQERLGDVSKSARRAIAEAMCSFPVRIAALGGWKTAMLTAGGIPTKEVNSRTMMSAKCSGLFFAGEVLDVDGDTGGFNLQAAFSTGMAAAKGIAEYLGG